MKNKNVICIFAKHPEPGKVKTRLEEIVGKDQAAFLARAFLMDTISLSLKIQRIDLFIAHWPPESKSGFEDILYLFMREEVDKRTVKKVSSIGLLPQSGDNLGERLTRASKTLFDMGASRIIFIGSDCPQMDPMILLAALELLKKYQAIVGPTFDGGFYIFGLSEHCPAVFEGISWDTPDIYRETVNRLNNIGLAWQELEISYDVDGPEDLEQLYEDIDNLRRAGEYSICYHTERCLENLVK